MIRRPSPAAALLNAALALLLACALVCAAPLPATAIPPRAAPSSFCFDRTLDDGRPRPICIGLAHYTGDVCTAIGRYADIWGLPEGFFARLIWRESHFNPNVDSFAGAQGIAQFMPDTGRLQGLGNPYDPAEALARSARYLRVLTDKFGNLGLAAAAYNGGEGAVSRFIAGTGYLAAETLDYVRIVTGVPVERWLAGDVKSPDFALQTAKPFQAACIELAETSTVRNFEPPTAIVQPWGIQMAQFFSSTIARRAFARIQARFGTVLGSEELMLVAKRNPNFGPALRFTAEIGRTSRADAQKLCTALQKAGGECIVVRNR